MQLRPQSLSHRASHVGGRMFCTWTLLYTVAQHTCTCYMYMLYMHTCTCYMLHVHVHVGMQRMEHGWEMTRSITTLFGGSGSGNRVC